MSRIFQRNLVKSLSGFHQNRSMYGHGYLRLVKFKSAADKVIVATEDAPSEIARVEAIFEKHGIQRLSMRKIRSTIMLGMSCKVRGDLLKSMVFAYCRDKNRMKKAKQDLLRVYLKSRAIDDDLNGMIEVMKVAKELEIDMSKRGNLIYATFLYNAGNY